MGSGDRAEVQRRQRIDADTVERWPLECHGLKERSRFSLGVLGSVVAAGFAGGGSVTITSRFAVGPRPLLSPGFGYTVAYRTVGRSDTAHTTIGHFGYDNGRWRNVAPIG